MPIPGTPPGEFYSPDPMAMEDQGGGAAMPQDTATALLQDPTSNVALASGAPTSSTTASQGSRSKLRIGGGPAGGRLYNQDFNPAGYKPNESRSTQVGKYGGAPLFTATIGAPFAVLDERENALARQSKEIDAAMRSFDPAAGLQDSKAVKYRDTTNDWAMGQIEGYMENINARYGEEGGIDRMRTKGSPEALGLRKLVGHLNATIGSIDDAVSKSHAVMEGMDKGELEYDEKMYQEAQEVEDRLGSYEATNNPEELATVLPRFNAKVSLMDQLKTDGIADLMKNAGSKEKLFDLVKRGDPLYQGMFSTLKSTETVSFDAIKDALTRRYAREYKNELTYDEVADMVGNIVQNSLVEDVERAPMPQRTGGTSGSGTVSAGVGGAYQYSIIPGTQGTRKFDQVRLSQISGGKGRLSAPIPLTDPRSGGGAKDGEEQYIHPVAVYEDRNGDLFIHGKVAKEPGVKVVEADDGSVTYTRYNPQTKQDEPIPETEYFNTLENVSVPYADNAGALETVLPGINEQYLRSAIQQGKGSRPATKEAAVAQPATTSATTKAEVKYYTDKAKPPPAAINARWNEGYGMYFVKDGGKWVPYAKK